MKIQIRISYSKSSWQIAPPTNISAYVYTNNYQYYRRFSENYPARNLRNFRRRYEKWIGK